MALRLMTCTVYPTNTVLAGDRWCTQQLVELKELTVSEGFEMSDIQAPLFLCAEKDVEHSWRDFNSSVIVG
jgi:hypothetical protein